MRKPILTTALGAVLLLFGVAFPQSGNIYTFFPDVEITDAPSTDGNALFESSGQHYTAFRGDTVYVVWHEYRGATPPVGGWILFAKSTDGGQTFGSSIPVAEGIDPSMKMDSAGNIFVAYTHLGYIYFSKSTDGGNTFTSPVLVTDSAGLAYYQEKPAIAVNNKGQVFIVWRDERNKPQSDPSVRNVFAATSYDEGLTFSPNIAVSDSFTPEVWGFDIASDDSGRVFVVWCSYISSLNTGVIYLGRSDDSGQTFSMRSIVKNFPSTPFFDGGLNPSMALGENVIGIVWENILGSNEYTLHFSSSSDYGQTFSPSVVVDSIGEPQTPSLVYENSMFYVAWRPENKRVFISYSVNRGQSFAPRVMVTSGLYSSIWPSLAVNEEGKVFVAWLDSRYDPGGIGFRHIFGARGTPNFAKGDLNLDGILTAVDVVMSSNAAFLGQSFPAPFDNADSNCDSLLTSVDVVLLVNATFLGSLFPCN